MGRRMLEQRHNEKHPEKNGQSHPRNGVGQCGGDARCRCRATWSRLNMSVTKKSSCPSRLMSATSTLMDDMLMLRRANRGAARNFRPGSFSQNWSGDKKKSLHT